MGKMGEMEKNWGKWRKKEENGGNGGKWEKNGTKCPFFTLPFSHIVREVKDLPISSLTDGKLGILPLTGTHCHGG